MVRCSFSFEGFSLLLEADSFLTARLARQLERSSWSGDSPEQTKTSYPSISKLPPL